MYPTLGVTTTGRGVISFSHTGENTFPSFGYAAIDDRVGVSGDIHEIEAGKSPQDGFTEYPPIGGNRPRWGDYSASAVDGNFVYVGRPVHRAGPVHAPAVHRDELHLLRQAVESRELEHAGREAQAVASGSTRWRGPACAGPLRLVRAP